MTGTSSPTATADNGRSSLGGTTMRFDGRAGSGTGDGVCKRVRDFFGSNSAFESKKTTVTTSRFWILIAFALFAAGYICGDIQLGAYDSHNLATVTKEDVLQIVTVAKEDVLQIVQQHARYSNQDHNMPTLTKADVLQMIKQHSSRDVSTPTTKQMLEVVPFTGSNFTSKKFDSQGLQIELQLTMSKIVLLLAFCFVAGVYLGSCLQPTLLQNLNRASTLPKDDTLDVAQPCLPETNVPPLTKDNVCQIVQICIDGANVSTLTTNDVVDVFNHCFQEAKISTITKEDIIEIYQTSHNA
ncbi:expressed unknown protein [Seminavis robusta]|uniref:Uncharacterized protein n=1 Tax=Seminavis robusta TaxID=568900 RepID=A0A9N8EPJ5_9STRA|nr:expressed unknown protein [Seminavis robusta]|eukprot:Sro1538_g280800.1 n/a (298) ;mRNA; r:21172-22145